MARPPARAAAALALAMVAIAIVWWAGHGAGGDRSATSQAVAVVVSAARQGSFVVWQAQPGTVVPANSVVVRSRVDGTLARVAFSGGQQVKQGELLAEIDPRPFQAQVQLARGDLARSQAQLANAEDTLRHYRALQAQDSISRQRVVDQQSLVSQYAAAVKAGQGRLDSAELQLSATRITSPISGTVGLRRVDPGNLVGPSDARGIAVVTQSQPSKVIFSLPVDVASHVLARLRQGACIPVDAYGDGPGDRLGSGRLASADNQVDPATGTVKFEARFANANGMLLPNQFVTARVPVEVLPRATLVPAAAIQQGADGPFVYVLKGDKTVAVVPVETGPGDGATTVLTAGVAPGAKVVVEGADRLRAGSAVDARTVAGPAPANGLPACRPDDAQPPARTAPAHS